MRYAGDSSNTIRMNCPYLSVRTATLVICGELATDSSSECESDSLDLGGWALKDCSKSDGRIEGVACPW